MSGTRHGNSRPGRVAKLAKATAETHCTETSEVAPHGIYHPKFSLQSFAPKVISVHFLGQGGIDVFLKIFLRDRCMVHMYQNH